MVTMTEPIYRLRSTGQYVKFVIALIFIALFVLSLYLDPNTDGFFPPIIIALGAGLVAYVFFYLPTLYLDRDGLHIHNWFMDRVLSWRDFEKLDTRFGMHIISADASDPVTCYPGTGGLTQGRKMLTTSSPLARSEPKQTYIPVHESGQYNLQPSLNEASSLITRMAKEFSRTSPHRPRTKTVNPMRVAMAMIGIALIIIGIQAII